MSVNVFDLGTPATTCFVDPSNALLSRAHLGTICGFNEPKQNFLILTKHKAAATNQGPQPFSTTFSFFHPCWNGCMVLYNMHEPCDGAMWLEKHVKIS
jgi:hypothetical protein